MDTLFYALAVILAGGVAPLLLYRQFELMKAVAVIAIAVGCLIGLAAALGPVMQDTGPPMISWSWQHALTLSYRIDSLSVFFLIPIFLICPLAALYGFHYLDKSEEAGRIAINYFFYALLIISMVLVVCADSLLTLALAWEVMSLTSYFLVVYEFQKKETRSAGYLYFVFAQAGAMCIFAAFGLIYSYTGSFSFDCHRPAARPGQTGSLCPVPHRLRLEGRYLSLCISGCPMPIRPPPAISRRSCRG